MGRRFLFDRSVVGGMKTVQKQKKKHTKDEEEKKTGEADLLEMSSMEDYDDLTPRRGKKRDGGPRFRGRGGSQDEEYGGGGRRQGRKARR